MMKKLLVLAGKPIGSCEIVNYAKQHGIYTIVTDYLSKEESAAKRLADECWDISTADVDTLVRLVKEQKIDGIYTGVHEFNIRKMIEVCTKSNLPCFCTLDQWDMLCDKRRFKELCREYDIPVAAEFSVNKVEDIDLIGEANYPLIIKPADGSGSRGFSICHNAEELRNSYSRAVEFSDTGSALIETFMNYHQSAIINYTLVNGKVYFSGISDKLSEKVFEDGAPIMAAQFYPSIYENNYLSSLNKKVKKMFEESGLKNGVIWIEAFCKNGAFTFNEMGFRFGGSLTYLPVKHFFGIDQLALQIDYALNEKNDEISINEKIVTNDLYCILPVHVKPGIIAKIDGLDLIQKREELVKIVPVHFIGDVIENWGSAQQVFAYLHFKGKTREELDTFAKYIIDTLKVYDKNNNQMLFNLYIR